MTDTIFALSSGAPPAAIAVIRISGPQALTVMERIAGPKPEPRRLVLRPICDPDDEGVIDHGLVTWFPAAGSVTGEALVELHLHGGRAVVDAVEQMLGRQPGMRAAKAGEFTWRAFQYGKLDLVEVESLSDLLRAETEAQRRAAVAGQGLSRDVERWRKDVLLLSALVEAQLDQSDEDDVPPDRSAIDSLAERLRKELGTLIDRPGAERLFDGIRVVFAGSPNTGKSTLINAIAQREVAITSAVPGTTRDVIEAPVRLGGTAFVLTDTAGLRDQVSDEIEREGIVRAERRLETADIVVWMDEAPPPPVAAAKVVHIFPRADQAERQQHPEGRLRVSAVTGQGMDVLIEHLVAQSRALLPREGEVALSRRQREHLERCHRALGEFHLEPEELLAAEQLRVCRRALDDLTGRAGTEEMLDSLFGTFCIGK